MIINSFTGFINASITLAATVITISALICVIVSQLILLKKAKLNS